MNKWSIFLLMVIVIAIVIYLFWNATGVSSKQYVYENGIVRTPLLTQSWETVDASFAECRNACSDADDCLGFVYDDKKKACTYMTTEGASNLTPADSKIKTYLKSLAVCEEGQKPGFTTFGEPNVLRTSTQETAVTGSVTEAVCRQTCIDTPSCSVAVHKPSDGSCKLISGSSTVNEGQRLFNSFIKVRTCT